MNDKSKYSIGGKEVKKLKCFKNTNDFDDVYFYPYCHCKKNTSSAEIHYAIFILNNQPVLERKAVECSVVNKLNKFVLWKHKEKLIGYREMNSTELRLRINEIGRNYEARKGFTPCRDKIGMSYCNGTYCTADNLEWYLNDSSLFPENYNAKTNTCPHNYNDVYRMCDSKNITERKCLRTANEFDDINFRNNTYTEYWCREYPGYYALYISDEEPELLDIK